MKAHTIQVIKHNNGVIQMGPLVFLNLTHLKRNTEKARWMLLPIYRNVYRIN